MHLPLLIQAATALREGRVGDAGVMKAIAMSPASYADVEMAVSRLAEPLPDLPALTQRLQPPEGTLGWHYAQFILRNGLTPLTASPDLAVRLGRKNLVAARYVLVHDAFHVLLGFDVSRCGELAVWSFVAAQKYNPAYEYAARVASWVYPLMEPTSRKQLARHRELGLQLGRETPCLIAQPIEHFWDQPLHSAREALGIKCAACQLVQR